MSSEPEERFSASMPDRYVKNVPVEVRAVHAKIAGLRGQELVNAGLFPSHRPDATAICVVANDRPGLLAIISAGLFAQGFNVIDAEAYTRTRPDGGKEAIDLFWVKRVVADAHYLPVSSAEVLALKARLSELLQEGAPPSPEAPKVGGISGETRVRFMEGESGTFSTLEVQSTDRPGLLLALSQALFEKNVQIVGCQVKTLGDKVLDRFELAEQDGGAIRPERQLEIQVAILSVVGEALLN